MCSGTLFLHLVSVSHALFAHVRNIFWRVVDFPPDKTVGDFIGYVYYIFSPAVFRLERPLLRCLCFFRAQWS